MGMFDEVNYRDKLPVDGWDGHTFQTHSFDDIGDLYEIRDGMLYLERYDTEDQSDPNAVGFMRLAGCMAKVNRKMRPHPYTGEVRFYGMKQDTREWVEFSAYFRKGQMVEINVV